MRTIFHAFLRLRRLPVATRYGISTLLVLLTFAACQLLAAPFANNGLVVFFPAIILASMFFDHGNGLLVVGLSALLAAYYFLYPQGEFAVAHSGDLAALVIFVVSGGITALLIETLHRTIADLTAAHADLRQTHDDLTKVHHEVQASERQKDLLLQELTHRTKNDLTLVSSLLQMQARGLDDSTARDVLNAAVERIRVLGNAHARLTRSAGTVVVDSHAFLEGLCDDLRAAFVGVRPVALICEAESHVLTHQRAVAIGLIANELVTNAMKYAFPGDRDGTVKVTFAPRGNDHTLIVEDDGVGIPYAAAKGDGASGGMGQRLVRTLTLQLRGRYECVPRDPGTICRVTFPLSEQEG